MGTIVEDGLDVRNAVNPLVLTITEKHVKKAACRSPGTCVIAQALADSNLGDVADEIVVGARCTKVRIGKRVLRYTTPSRLRRALILFDDTEGHVWHLPPGQYTLLPYDGGKNRWSKARRKGGTQSKFKGIRKTPSRKTPNYRTMLRRAA